MTLEEVKEQLMKNPEFKAEYEALEPEYALIRQVIQARIDKKMTQAELAQKVGTKQSKIARFESGWANPSVKFIQKIARALETPISVTFA